MSAAGEAFDAARQEIARVQGAGDTLLDLNEPEYRALTRLPEEIADLADLTFLSLRDTEVKDLTPIAGLSALTTLSLSGTQVADLTPIAGLSVLTALYLDDTPVTDLTPIAGLSALTRLFLNGTLVTDLSPIAGLSALTRLYLNDTQVTDLAPIAGLSAPTRLFLNGTLVTDLTPIAGLSALTRLYLNDTQVTDLAPIAGLSALTRLDLKRTQVTDLTPIAGLSALTRLYLLGSRIKDLRPLKNLTKLSERNGLADGLFITDTPALDHDPELRRLYEIENRQERTRQILAYLQSLDPPPAPLPWEKQATLSNNVAQSATPSETPAEPLDLLTFIEAQDRAGWRYSPIHGAVELYVRDAPLEAQQSQLARLAKQRLDKLLKTLGGRVQSGGLRQEVYDEAQRFGSILAAGDAALAQNALDLWSSLIALGDLLEGNDRAARAGRDPLDLLTHEARAALQTFIGIAASLVRSFPDARDLDEGHSAFERRQVTPEMLLDVVEAALRVSFVDAKSAGLMQHVLKVASHEGTQAEKAETVSRAGIKNLITAAAMILAPGVYVADGVAQGALTDIGAEISEHYDLGEKAIALLEDKDGVLQAVIDALTPDERAVLNAAIEDARRVGPQ